MSLLWPLPLPLLQGAPCAASILEEALFIQAVYHPSAHNRCLPLDKICSIPSLTRLVSAPHHTAVIACIHVNTLTPASWVVALPPPPVDLLLG